MFPFSTKKVSDILTYRPTGIPWTTLLDFRCTRAKYNYTDNWEDIYDCMARGALQKGKIFIREHTLYGQSQCMKQSGTLVKAWEDWCTLKDPVNVCIRQGWHSVAQYGSIAPLEKCVTSSEWLASFRIKETLLISQKLTFNVWESESLSPTNWPPMLGKGIQSIRGSVKVNLIQVKHNMCVSSGLPVAQLRRLVHFPNNCSVKAWNFYKSQMPSVKFIIAWQVASGWWVVDELLKPQTFTKIKCQLPSLLDW